MKEKEFNSLSLGEQEEVVRRESLPHLKKLFAEIEIRRTRILCEVESLEGIISSSLFFEKEETDLLQRSTSTIRESLTSLESALSLLEGRIQEVESSTR